MQRPPRLLSLALCALPLVAVGCDDDPVDRLTEPPLGEPSPSVDDTPTWHQDIAPIVAERCGACHAAGGAAPFALDTPQMAAAMAPASLAAIESGSMPPWMGDPDCRTYQNSRLMPADEIALFRAWVEAAPPSDPCAEGTACLERCVADGRSSTACVLACDIPLDCKTCALNATMGCGGAACITPLLSMRDSGCLESCMVNNLVFGGDMTACLDEICPADSTALSSCLDGPLDSGACHEAVASCGFELAGR